MENQDTNKMNDTTNTKINNRSMSDTESLTSQVDSFHSPLRSDSPLHDDPFPPYEKSPLKSPSKAIVAVNKFPVNPPSVKTEPSVVVLNRAVREELGSGVTKVGPAVGAQGYGGGEDGVGGERRSREAVASILRRPRREVTVERAALGFRVCEVILCLISFSVMAADKTQGWSGDSFDRYKEYRYCLSVTVIAFVYSGFQAYDLAYHLITEKHVISHHLRYHFDFLLDQILAYLLISASSSAATRVDDWVSNWGKDEFTEMASASVGMSFLAFAAFALSSLISGYNLCNRNSI